MHEDEEGNYMNHPNNQMFKPKSHSNVPPTHQVFLDFQDGSWIVPSIRNVPLPCLSGSPAGEQMTRTNRVYSSVTYMYMDIGHEAWIHMHFECE